LPQSPGGARWPPSTPLSGRYALACMRALSDRGDRADALAFARTHEAVVRRELETDPDREVQKLVRQLRAVGPLPTAARPAARPDTEADQVSYNAAGDTGRVRALADTIAQIVPQSLYARDRGLPFFLRGHLAARQGRHAEAVALLRKGTSSWTYGFTRVN